MIDGVEYSKQKKKCHLLCYIYFCWFRNFKGKNRVWPFHTRIISSWSLKSRKFSASFLLLYSLIFSVKRPLAVLLVIKHSSVKAATHFHGGHNNINHFHYATIMGFSQTINFSIVTEKSTKKSSAERKWFQRFFIKGWSN